MSDPENFLSRWSRRKREADERTEDAASEGAASRRTEDNDKPDRGEATSAPTESGAPVFDIESLPPIESITAATDIRPFLASGVPAELSRAALRRAWVVDPKVRDFVGLADYDWDFRTPGAISGFGDLDMTPEVRRQIARIVGDAFPEAPSEPTAGITQPVQSTENSAEPPATSSAAAAITAGRQDEEQSNERTPALPSHAEQRPEENIATQHRSRARDHVHSTLRRGHGGALPK